LRGRCHFPASRVSVPGSIVAAGQPGPHCKTRLAAEAAGRARGAGFEVFAGRSIDLVGTELPYLP